MAVTLLIPHDFMNRPAIGYCGICETPFYTEKGMRAHLRSGGHAAQVEIERAAQQEKRERLAIFYDPESTGSDPEIAEHLKKVGQRMLKEGRWEVKRNERAGFS
jgi:ABC-type histidine transport system ATPase subunit